MLNRKKHTTFLGAVLMYNQHVLFLTEECFHQILTVDVYLDHLDQRRAKIEIIQLCT